MPTPAPRSKRKKRRSVAPVRIIPSPQDIRNAASKASSRVKNSILVLHDSAKKPLKGYVEGETRKENQEEEDVDLTPHEHERALKGSYSSFVMAGKPKIDINSYFDQAKPHIKMLIENQLKEMGSAKIIMILWVMWKKHIKLLIDPEDFEDAVDKGRPALLVSPSLQEIDEFEKEEMKKSKPLVKNKLNE